MTTRDKLIGLVISTAIVAFLCSIPIVWWFAVESKSPPSSVVSSGCPVYTCSCDGNSATLNIEAPSEK
jgi:hypothetical protein